MENALDVRKIMSWVQKEPHVKVYLVLMVTTIKIVIGLLMSKNAWFAEKVLIFWEINVYYALSMKNATSATRKILPSVKFAQVDFTWILRVIV